MNVNTLQAHLSNLSQFLRGAGAERLARELGEVCQLFQPYSGLKVKELLARITKADEILARPSGGSSRSRRALDPQVVAELDSRLTDLYGRAGQEGAVTRAEIEAAFADPRIQLLTEAQLKITGAKLDSPYIRGKEKFIERMKNTVLKRMGSLERVHA